MSTNQSPSIISKKEWWKILELSDRQELLQERRDDVIATFKLGIAEEMTPKIWEFLTESENLKTQQREINFSELKNRTSDYEVMIKKDLPTSIENFHGSLEDFQKMLFNVLKVYSIVNKEINYCSGMHLIAQSVLYNLVPQDEEFEIVYDSDEIEEQCFWIFYYIMEKQNWKVFYGTSRVKCLQILNEFDELFKKELPRLHLKLNIGKVETKYFFIPHFYTLLMNSCPISESKRTITNFLVYGIRAIEEILINNLRKVEQEILRIKSPEQFIIIIQQLLSHVSQKYGQNDQSIF